MSSKETLGQIKKLLVQYGKEVKVEAKAKKKQKKKEDAKTEEITPQPQSVTA